MQRQRQAGFCLFVDRHAEIIQRPDGLPKVCISGDIYRIAREINSTLTHKIALWRQSTIYKAAVPIMCFNRRDAQQRVSQLQRPYAVESRAHELKAQTYIREVQ